MFGRMLASIRFFIYKTLVFIFMEGKAISDLMINGQIRDKEVRVIGEDGEQLGIMSAAEAQKIADEAGLDLVKIAPTAKPLFLGACCWVGITGVSLLMQSLLGIW